jgi:hypothetical protein
MNVKLIRMSSGEDIICDLIEESDSEISICDPIVAVPAGNGQIGFAPWSPLIDKNVKKLNINKKFVVYITETTDRMVQEYTSMFSNIITPSKQLQL